MRPQKGLYLPPDPAQHRTGVALAASGMFVLSFDALLVRLADASSWDILFWRGWLIAVALVIYLKLIGRMREFAMLRGFWRPALFIAALYALGSSLFVVSIQLTRVANTVLVLSCTPFSAALFSWLLLGERIPLRTLLAMLAAMAGIVVVFAGATGYGGINDLYGILLALLIAISTGLTLTLLRKHSGLPLVPVLALSGVLVGVLASAYAAPLAIGSTSLGWLLLMGLIQIPLAWICALTATRYIPAPEVSLFLLIETVMGPVWVWLVLDEAIPDLTLLGGAFILAAVATNAWLGLRGAGRLPSAS